MNLLHDPWMPVRDDAGMRHWIAPDRLAEPQWRAFDADRPDFNGALAQFAIGLLQTTTPVDSPIEWRRCFNNPPSGDTLRQWFAPVTEAFVFDGDGPRFMQDVDLGDKGIAVNDIGVLLIDAPGEQTLKNNADHFVKRGQISALCAACAATALFTLQVNAPAGGRGNRTGLRGGGPLTTLVLAPEPASLWQHLWLNVAMRSIHLARCGDKRLDEPRHRFPWLAAISKLQAPGETSQTASSQVHPDHVFWAMPRRIRLEAAPSGGLCDVCGRDGAALYKSRATRPYGLNYEGEWDHPLSPYYRKDNESFLCVHPQRDGVGYRHWMAWVLGVATDRQSVRAASVVQRALALPPQTLKGPLRLWAFGFAMEKATALCWYEATLPLYHLADCSADAQRVVQAEVARWLAAADLGGSYLRDAIKEAWFDANARGDFSQVDAAFWDATESGFYRQLQALIEATRQGVGLPPLPTREAWHRQIVGTAVDLFDDRFVGTGPIEQQNPRRTVLARKQLLRNLHGPKLRAALGLPVDQADAQPKRKAAAARRKEIA